MPVSRFIVCEISARTAEPIDALEQIVRTCARDVGQAIKIRRSHTSLASAEPVVTLHLPAELAATQHPIWCLACRLACFCPQARISVLVRAAHSFAHKNRRKRRPAISYKLPA